MAIMTTKKTNLFSNQAIRTLVVVLVIAGLIGAGYFGYMRFTAPKVTTTQEASVQTAKATVGNLVLYAHGTGTVMPAAESSISSSSNGQVRQINVKIGDQVNAGDLLAQLDDTHAQIQLANAQEAMNKLTSA